MKKFLIIVIVGALFLSIAFPQNNYYHIFQYIENNSEQELIDYLNENQVNLNNIQNQDGLYPLHFAAYIGKYRFIPILIRAGADVNLEIDSGFPATIAIRQGNIDCLRQILDAHFDPDRKTQRNGWSSLHWAAAFGQFEIAKMLINDYKATVNIYSDDHKLPYELAEDENYERLSNYLKLKGWMEAARTGNIDLLKVYLSRGISVDIQDPESYQRTALFVAAKNGQANAVQFLIQNEANVNAQDEREETPIWLACVNGNLQIVRILINNGAQWRNSVPSYGFPVSQAVSNGNIEVVRYFIDEMGFNVNAQDNEGWTLLHWAARFNQSNMANFLLQKGADRNIRNNDGNLPFEICENERLRELLNPENPLPMPIGISSSSAPITTDASSEGENLNAQLLRAADTGRGDLILSIINNGADINTTDENGRTPLHLAAEHGYFNTARTLINLGADVNRQDRNHFTPIFLAASKGHLDIIKLLINNGANWKTSVPELGFPVSQAVANGYLNIVQYFIEEQNFDINAQDNEGYTLLHVAAQFKQPEIAQYLLKKGINIWIRENTGKTALDIARDSHSTQVLNILSPLYENQDIPSRLQNALSAHDSIAVQQLYKENPQFKDHDGNTILHYCVLYNCPEILNFLIRENKPPLDIQNSQNETPLLLAIKQQNLRIVRILVENDAYLYIPSDSAVFKTLTLNDSIPILRYLTFGTYHSIPINKQDESGKTLLHWAVIRNAIHLAHFLMEKGANVNIPDHKGWTPLFYAIQNRDSVICKDLLKHKASINIRTATGLTPQLLAKKINFNILDAYNSMPSQKIKILEKNILLWVSFHKKMAIKFFLIFLVFLIIFISVKFLKKSKIPSFDALKGLQLISSTGAGKIIKYNNLNDFHKLASVQEALQLVKKVGNKNTRVIFRDEFLIIRKNKMKKKQLFLEFSIDYSGKIDISILNKNKKS